MTERDLNRFTGPLAAYYDALHADGDVGDEPFYREAALAAAGPVLEAGCGTGRLTVPLLRAGVDVDAFDVAAPMLDRLRGRVAGTALETELTCWQADLRRPATARTYGLVVVPFITFGNMRTVEAQLAALEALHDVLRQGGRLLLDVFVPSYETVAESFGRWHSEVSFEYEGRRLTGRSRATVEDVVAQTYRTEQEVRDDDGALVARETFVLSHLPPQQVEVLARHSPFRSWSVTGDFTEEPLADGHSVQVWELTA